MRVFESFDSFLNEGYGYEEMYDMFMRIGRSKISRKPAYTSDLFGSKSLVTLTPAQDKDLNVSEIPVYSSKDVWGKMAPRGIYTSFKNTPKESLFVLYLNHEQGELKDYYGMTVFVDTQGAEYVRYGFGMDFEPELHQFAMGIPEESSTEEEFDKEVNEGKIQLKRRYTETYPQISVSTFAPVRNKIIEAIADGHITSEYFESIIKEFSTASKKWARGNKHYFNVSEEGISLSTYGKRILSRIKTVNENE